MMECGHMKAGNLSLSSCFNCFLTKQTGLEVTLVSRGNQFECWLGHQLSWLRYCCSFPSVPPGKCHGSTLLRLMTLSTQNPFQFIIPLSPYQSTLCSVATDSIVKWQTITFLSVSSAICAYILTFLSIFHIPYDIYIRK
jgi:hypothetical protein